MEPTNVLSHEKSYDTEELRDNMIIVDKLTARSMFSVVLKKGEYHPLLGHTIRVKKYEEDGMYKTYIWQNVFKP